MNESRQKQLPSGQALITLLLFVIISVTITSAAIVIIFINSKSNIALEQNTLCHSVAESGVENALLRLLRNPGYTGETMNVNGGTVLVQVSGNGNPYTITASCSYNFAVITMQATATLVNNVMTITSWKQI